MLKIYDTLTKSKIEFKPLEENKVKMYSCGITVSGEAHIGHAMQALIFDVIRKYLMKKGYDVLYARNYTDVDDKIIAKALTLNMDPMELAEKNIKETDEVMHNLKIDDPDLILKATDHIERIIEFIKVLIEKGSAYVTDAGDVYFKVDSFKDYGKLSNRKTEDAYTSVRIDNKENKTNPLDFALWKSAKPNEIYWDSPWGKGRPGWHIECSCMNYYNLGEQIDIHAGGRDLIFPHHENEIAQTESFTGKQFSKYWIHNGLVKVNSQKMSKSLGNVILAKDLLEKYDSDIIRFALLQTKYHNDINVTDDLFEESKKHLIYFYQILKQVEDLKINDDALNEKIDKDFNEAMDDDFNTAKAIANLFEIFKTMKNKINNNDLTVKQDYNQVKKTYSIFNILQKDVNEFLEKNKEIKSQIPQEILEIAKQRWQAKLNKDFATADNLRKVLSEKGYEIKDSKESYEIITK